MIGTAGTVLTLCSLWLIPDLVPPPLSLLVTEIRVEATYAARCARIDGEAMEAANLVVAIVSAIAGVASAVFACLQYRHSTGSTRRVVTGAGGREPRATNPEIWKVDWRDNATPFCWTLGFVALPLCFALIPGLSDDGPVSSKWATIGLAALPLLLLWVFTIATLPLKLVKKKGEVSTVAEHLLWAVFTSAAVMVIAIVSL